MHGQMGQYMDATQVCTSTSKNDNLIIHLGETGHPGIFVGGYPVRVGSHVMLYDTRSTTIRISNTDAGATPSMTDGTLAMIKVERVTRQKDITVLGGQLLKCIRSRDHELRCPIYTIQRAIDICLTPDIHLISAPMV
jgi:hypothetical protein